MFLGAVAVAGGAFLVLPPAATAAVEVRVGFGGWTLAPFHTLIESRCEETVQNEFNAYLDSVLPEWMLSPVRAEISLTSSGRTLYAEIWVPLGRSRFAVGARGDVFRFRIPFTASASETVQIIGLPIAELHGTADGTVELEGVGVSLMGRWRAVSSRRFDLALRAGVSGFPFRGRVATSLALVARTPLGDYAYSDFLDRTIAEVRESGADVPAFLIAPLAGLEIGFRLARNFGLFANVTVSHGTFYSAGISASL